MAVSTRVHGERDFVFVSLSPAMQSPGYVTSTRYYLPADCMASYKQNSAAESVGETTPGLHAQLFGTLRRIDVSPLKSCRVDASAQ